MQLNNLMRKQIGSIMMCAVGLSSLATAERHKIRTAAAKRREHNFSVFDARPRQDSVAATMRYDRFM